MGKCFSKPKVRRHRHRNDYPESATYQDLLRFFAEGTESDHKILDQIANHILKEHFSPERQSLGSKNNDDGVRESSTDEENRSNTSERTAVAYGSLDQVKDALHGARFNLPSIITGIDFTRSNLRTGERSFNSESLHHTGDSLNRYEQAISIIWETLTLFSNDKLFSCFGFGDASTRDKNVFEFYPDGMKCQGIGEVQQRYREIVHLVKFSGPTSLAPIIEMAMTIAQKTFQYHVLLIIANGEESEFGALQEQQKTIESIQQARNLPLFIILVGVGDDNRSMRALCNKIPACDSDHFQFFDFTEIMSKNEDTSSKEREVALAALQKIPAHYNAATMLNPFSRKRIHDMVPLPPPAPFSSTELFQLAGSALLDGNCDEICVLCYAKRNEVVFNCCWNQTCSTCAEQLAEKCFPCPFCRSTFQR